MLEIRVHGTEFFNQETNEFFYDLDNELLVLEHSLVAVSKWEAKYHRSFLAHPDKTVGEWVDYVRFMTINEPNPKVYECLNNENFVQIKEYIENPMTATYIHHTNGSSGPKDTITSELIYYWMIAMQIPFECQYWHLNRLMTLIDVCSSKNKSPDSKMSKSDIMRKNAAINAARRNKLHSRG